VLAGGPAPGLPLSCAPTTAMSSSAAARAAVEDPAGAVRRASRLEALPAQELMRAIYDQVERRSTPAAAPGGDLLGRLRPTAVQRQAGRGVTEALRASLPGESPLFDIPEVTAMRATARCRVTSPTSISRREEGPSSARTCVLSDLLQEGRFR
jgi:hypothetical protein